MIELIGYLASVFLAFSLLTVNTIKFRWFNILGCIAFITYGIVIFAFPVIISNCILLAINVYHLYKIYARKEIFSLVATMKGDGLMHRFIEFYKINIKDTITYNSDDNISFFVLQDMQLVHLFVAKVHQDGIAWVTINYAIPSINLKKLFQFVFINNQSFFRKNNIKKIVFNETQDLTTEKILVIVGFKKEVINAHSCWVLHLIPK